MPVDKYSIIQDPTGVTVTKEEVGLKETQEQLRKIGRKIHPLLDEKLHELASRIMVYAKQMCPVDTGALMLSIRILEESGEKGVGGSYEVMAPVAGYMGEKPIVYTVAAGGGGYINPKTLREVDYAEAVHDGTFRMPPRPFMSDAEVLARVDWVEMENKIMGEINKLWKENDVGGMIG